MGTLIEIARAIALAFVMTMGLLICVAAIFGGCIVISILVGCLKILYCIFPSAVVVGMIIFFILIL